MIKELIILPFTLNVANAFDYSRYTFDNYNYTSLLLIHTATNDRVVQSDSNILLNPNGELFISVDISVSTAITNSTTLNPNITPQYFFNNDVTLNVEQDIFNIDYLGVYFEYQVSFPYIEFDLFVETNTFANVYENFININFGTWTSSNSQVIIINNYLFEIYNLNQIANYGKESYLFSSQGQQQVTNSIWSFFQNAIETCLYFLNFNILPGIPLYLCVAIPILFALLLWFIRLTGS